MSPEQPPLGLPFPRRRAMGREDFVVGPANRAAAALIGAPQGWPEGRLGLSGPPAAGKTHLVHVFMAETGAVRVPAEGLTVEAVPALVAAGAVALEDLDRALPDPDGVERAAFHLMNLARAEGVPLLLTGREPPARWPAALPDLASRLASLTVARLDAPDDALLAAVIAKHLADRLLTYEPALPAFLVGRIERSFAAARAAVERLDEASLAERRNLTRQLARTLFPADADPDQQTLDLRPQNRHQ